jgi:hypothetical protein
MAVSYFQLSFPPILILQIHSARKLFSALCFVDSGLTNCSATAFERTWGSASYGVFRFVPCRHDYVGRRANLSDLLSGTFCVPI